MAMASTPRPILGSQKASLAVPSSLSYLFDLNKKLPKIIRKVAREFQDSIRLEARPVWGEVADTIQVVYDSADQSIHVFSVHPDANKLEYGDIDTPPQPVLRKAAYSAQSQFADRVSELLHRGVN